MYHNLKTVFLCVVFFWGGGGGVTSFNIYFIYFLGGGGGGGESPALAWYTVSVCACSDDLCDYAFGMFRVQFHV